MTEPAEPHRVALYFAPAPDDALARAAAAWLGRDAWGGRAPAAGSPPDAGPDALVTSPRRYGFHATLKAPFRLAESETLASLEAALEAFAERMRAVIIPEVALGRLGPFFALVEATPSGEVAALAEAVVTAFEPFRAPLSEAEIARRRQASLGEREDAYLLRYGYPYVLDAFRFHMTLTGPVAEEKRDAAEAVLRDRFAAHIGRPLAIDAVALFVEPDPGAPFVALRRHELAR